MIDPILYLVNQNQNIADYFTSYPQIYLESVNFDAYDVTFQLVIMSSADPYDVQLCDFTGADYLTERQPARFSVANTYGMCAAASYFPSSDAKYNDEGFETMTGPGGDIYEVYTMDQLLSAMYN